MPTQKLTSEIITAAIEGFEVQRERLDAQIAELRGLLSGGRAQAAGAEGSTGKRTVSAAARRKMAMAQRARWARVKGKSAPEESAGAAQPARRKRRLSPE